MGKSTAANKRAKPAGRRPPATGVAVADTSSIPFRASQPHLAPGRLVEPVELPGGDSLLLDSEGLKMVLTDLADQIQNDFPAPDEVMLVGIRTRGVHVAERLKEILDTRYDTPIALGTVDITLYRDDLSALGPQPVVRDCEFPFDVKDAFVILVDDVLYTGRTVRAALDELVDFGRPRLVRLAALVDRGWREYPVQADYIGIRCATTQDQIVKVALRETDGEDRVFMAKRPAKRRK